MLAVSRSRQGQRERPAPDNARVRFPTTICRCDISSGSFCSCSFSPPAAPMSSPDGWRGPSIEIGKPEKFVGQQRRSRSPSAHPGAKLKTLKIVLRAERQADAAVHARATPAGASVKLDGPDKLRITRDDRQTDGARSQDRAGQDRRHGVAAGASRHPDASSRPRRATCRCGSNGRASRWCRRSTTSISAAPRWWSTAPRRPT